MRVREDIDVVYRDPAKLAALRLAFRTLESPPSGVRSLRDWANVHGNDRPFRVPCEHGSEMIWPWHRAYLYEFETALRNSHPPETSDVTLPYWNWTCPPTGFRYPRAYEEAGSLFDRTRLTTPHPAAPLSLATERFLLGVGNWRSFGGGAKGMGGGQGQLESQLHNFIHTPYVSRTSTTPNMGWTATSARDPIFWAHHANLDRIWWEWQRAHPRARLAEPSTRLREIPRNPPAGDWWNVDDRYVYGAKADPECSGMNDDDRVRLPDLLAVVPVSKAESTLRYAFDVPPGEVVGATLLVDGVQLPNGQAGTVRVYVHPAATDLTTQEGDVSDFFLTYFSIWSAHTEEGDKHEGGDPRDQDHGAVHGTHKFILDVTNGLNRLVRSLENEKESPTSMILTMEFVGYGDEEQLRPVSVSEGVAVDSVSVQWTLTHEPVRLKPLAP